MSISNAVWFLVGGIFSGFVTLVVCYNMMRPDYTEDNDYYQLDPITIDTPSYKDLEEFDDYDGDEFD